MLCESESDAKTHRTPKALRARIYRNAPALFCEALGVRTRPPVAFRAVSSNLRTDAPECESGLGLYHLTVHLK